MTRHRRAFGCGNCDGIGCESCPPSATDPDVEWLALHHDMAYSAVAELLGSEPACTLCSACLTWLEHGESGTCKWCRGI